MGSVEQVQELGLHEREDDGGHEAALPGVLRGLHHLGLLESAREVGRRIRPIDGREAAAVLDIQIGRIVADVKRAVKA